MARTESDLQRTLAATSGGGTTATTGAKPKGSVYWGSSEKRIIRNRNVGTVDDSGRTKYIERQSSTKVSDQLDSVKAGMALLSNMDNAKRIHAALVASGYIGKTATVNGDSVKNAWQQILGESEYQYANGNKLTPWQILDSLSGSGGSGSKGSGGSRSSGGGGGGGRARGFDGKRSTSSTAFDYTDATTAKALVNNILAEQLGRDAKPEELAQFTAALTAAEKASPVTVNTTSTYSDGAEVAQTSTRTGGLDAPGKSQAIDDKVENSTVAGESGGYKAGQYMQALNKLLGG